MCCRVMELNRDGLLILTVVLDHYPNVVPHLYYSHYFNMLRKNVKCFPSHGRGAILHFCSPQPDISVYCETMDTGLVHHVVCLFMPQFSAVPSCTKAYGCEQLVQRCYSPTQQLGLNFATSDS